MSYIRSAVDAERNAAVQMTLLGFPDARVTEAGADGGIDVISKRALAQVKWQGGMAGRPDLQRLYGARGIDHVKAMLFFTASGYSRSAVEYADTVNMALFVYDPTGELEAVNTAATALIRAKASDSAMPRKTQRPTLLQAPGQPAAKSPMIPEGKPTNFPGVTTRHTGSQPERNSPLSPHVKAVDLDRPDPKSRESFSEIWAGAGRNVEVNPPGPLAHAVISVILIGASAGLGVLCCIGLFALVGSSASISVKLVLAALLILASLLLFAFAGVGVNEFRSTADRTDPRNVPPPGRIRKKPHL